MTKTVEVLDATKQPLTENVISIYKISFSGTDKVYIGSTNNPTGRWNQHIRELKKGRHHSVKLQRHYSKHKIEPVFEVVDTCGVESRLDREDFWINHQNSLHKGFNMRPAERVLSGDELLLLKEERLLQEYISKKEKLLSDTEVVEIYQKLMSIIKSVGEEVRPDVMDFKMQIFDKFGARYDNTLKSLKQSLKIGVSLFDLAISELQNTSIDSTHKTVYVKASWNAGQTLSSKPIKRLLGYENTKTNFELIMESLYEYNKYNELDALNRMIEEDYKEYSKT